MSGAHKDLVRAFAEAGNRNDLEAFDGLLAPGFVRHCEATHEGAMGPFPPTGKRLQSEIAGMFRIEEGRIAELWFTWDNLSGLIQLGLFPGLPTSSD